MLLNFCDPRLCPEIKCSAVSTDGYEVTNLISDSGKGYLAYSCIKPPIHIDITFLCNVSLNHVLIWPAVGSQKSSGFQLSSRNTNDNNIPYTLLSSGFLGSHDAGLLFYSGDIDPTGIPTPANFLRRYIKTSMRHLTKYAHVLRITICKTVNSVPALGKIEVWGTVSPRCGKDVVASVHTLWAKRQAPSPLHVTEFKTDTTSIDTRDNRLKNDATLEVPESFLDSITWELMTQPVILPSGNVIDQTTLEKHEKNEAIWGRPLSDPFTGLGFNDDRRPVMATALKSRIDKFLLDNSNRNEVKRMPRVLGRDPASAIAGDRRIIEVPKCVLHKNLLKRTAEDIKPSACKQITDNSQCIKRYCHKLPIAVMPKRPTACAITKPKQLTKISTSSKLAHNSQNQNRDDKLDLLLSNMKRFSTPEKVELHDISNKCDCCKNSIFYRLPCKHVICRKVLLSVENSQCKSCGFSYKSSEIERIHDNTLNR
ncbi:RING finger protein 37 [Temnothorax nylanderi]|uniref:RING finger protein 37 n=1 Tax=Temnothorax nylanderi TaxID=102681 RepID=UPI003A899B75